MRPRRYVAKDQVTTQAEFFQTHAVDGVLPDHLMAQLVALPEGDISLVIDVNAPTIKDPGASPDTDGQDDTAAAPAAAPTPAPAAAVAAAPTPPVPAAPAPQVVLAKDGVHTIPYERLEEARQLAAESKRQADEAARRTAELEAENARLKAATPAPSPAQAPAAPAAAPAAPAATTGLFGDYSDAQLAAGIEKLVTQRTADLQGQIATLQQQLTPVQQAATLTANEQHWREIYTAHPDTDSLVESSELAAWIGAQPSFVRAQYEKVLNEGMAGEVVELFSAYKTATGIPATPPAPSAAAAATAAAQAAIANARQPAPTSLSEIPAGTSANHDEAAAMLEATPMALMQRLEGLSPAEVERRLSRIL